MTAYQDAQEENLAIVRNYLSCTSLRVDRSRHESVTHTAIWIFDRGGKGGAERQIACIVNEATPTGIVWRVNALSHGMAISEVRVPTLLDACGAMLRATKGV